MGELVYLAQIRRQRRIKTNPMRQFLVMLTQAVMRWLRPCVSCVHATKAKCDRSMCPYGS